MAVIGDRSSGNPPPIIPDHELLRRIGAGSYGEVWLARNILGTYRAVKLVWRQAFESDRPYEREFKGIQKFEPLSRSHPGLVDILQIGRDDVQGYFYYVMELADPIVIQKPQLDLDGTQPKLSPPDPVGGFDPLTYSPRTMRREIDLHGGLGFEDCVDHFLNLTDGLEALHTHGLIHRDIKPSNIILVRGVAKFADIGLVAEAGESHSFVGTEGFIAPEGPGTSQGDIYSLGKVLYEAATGLDRLDFPSLPPDPLTSSITAEMLELNALLLKACTRDPAERYRHASEFHGDLVLLKSGRSVKKLRLLEHRLQWARQAGLVAGSVAILALAAFLFAGYRAKVEHENATKLQLALDRERTAEGKASDRLYDSLEATAVARVRSGIMGQRFASLEATIRAAELRPDAPALRDAAITALVLPDLREIQRVPMPSNCNAQAFGPNLEQFIQADLQGLLHVRSAVDGAELFTLGKPDGAIDLLVPQAANPRWLSAVRFKQGSDWWDVTGRRLIKHIPQDYNGCMSADGHWLVMPLSSGGIEIHDLTQGTSRVIDPGQGYVMVAPGPEGVFAAATEDRTLIKVFSFQTEKKLYEVRLPARRSRMSTMQFSPDGNRLAVGLYIGRLLFYNWREGENTPTMLEPHSNAIEFVRFHPDGDWCLTSSWDTTTRLIGLGEGKAISLWRHPMGVPVFTADGMRVGCFESPSGDLVRMDVEGRVVCRSLGEPNTGLDSAPGPWNGSFSPDGQMFAAATYNGVRLYETRLGHEVGWLNWTNCYDVVFAGNQFLYAGGPWGAARWPLEWRKDNSLAIGPRKLLDPELSWYMQASEDGSVVTSTGYKETLVVRGNETLSRFPHFTQTRNGFLSRDGRLFVVTSPEGVKVFDTSSGKIYREFNKAINSGASFSPDGKRLLLNDYSAVRLLNLEDGKEVWSSPFPRGTGATAWSPNGYWVAVVREGMVCILIDAQNGQVLARLEHPDPRAYGALVFSPDSSKLACISTSHLIHLWNLRALRRELDSLKLDWKSPSFPIATDKVVAPMVVVDRSGP